ncbi:hypothetical protein COV18_01010 [Candidatus Woesearchaeota archaeon CG10_big_fil_rev_8_21_14_0_10_37_12]|nr:MAG: hypothetical protein COV18_01010 [Candidatus Woesearchaeota archaeon CG10_big_fil_rev_8_21_14_0_10_37_12]
MKLVALLSGGIDSPVAVYKFLKLGHEVICVHFVHHTTVGSGIEKKVVKLVKQLKNYGTVKLVIVPFKDIQLEIIKNVPATVRMLIYRRMMLRIAEQILKKESAKHILTGDNLGQVASQTLQNLNAVYASIKTTILTPLLGFDKVDIIKVAKQIGTYDISILPYEDCCSFLVAEHPELRASPGQLAKVEEKLDVQKVVNLGLSNAKLANLN